MQLPGDEDRIELELDQLAVSYGRRRVLANISLRLHTGEVLVVTGDNGSGKSTLLRVLCGLQRPDAGAVRYHANGQALLAQEARQLIGWVAPDLMLYRDLSAFENLRFFADVRGLRMTAAEIEAVLAEVDLAGRGADLLAAYSTGMAQRLRYAYALLHRPPVLLLDEPTATLDAGGASLVEALIARQRQRGLLVLATNDAREQRYGDYLLTLGERR